MSSQNKPESSNSINKFDIINAICGSIWDFCSNFRQIILPVTVSAIGGSLTNYFASSNGAIDFSRGLLLGVLQYIIYMFVFKHLGMWVYNNTGENKLSHESSSVLFLVGDVAHIYVPLYLMQHYLQFLASYWNWGSDFVPFVSHWFIVDTTAPFSLTLGFICGFVPSLTAFGLTLLTAESEKDAKKIAHKRH